jgi:hypothetical protein
MKFKSIKLQRCGIKIMWHPFQVQGDSSISTDICLDLCDTKSSRPVSTLALLILYNWLYINITSIYIKWIYVV